MPFLARWFANKLILKPTRHEIRVDDMKRHQFRSSVGSIELFERVFDGTVSNRTDSTRADGEQSHHEDVLILKLPGVGGRAEYSSDYPAGLIDAQGSIFTWNMPGYGRSQGPAQLQNILPVLIEIYDQLISEHRVSRPPFLVGTSLGGALAIALACERPVSGIVAYNPPSLPQLLPRFNKWWNGWAGGSFLVGGVPPEFDTLQRAALCRCKALFVRSMQDSLVPPSLQQQIIEAYTGEKRVVDLQDADHGTKFQSNHLQQIKPQMQWLFQS